MTTKNQENYKRTNVWKDNTHRTSALSRHTNSRSLQFQVEEEVGGSGTLDGVMPAILEAPQKTSALSRHTNSRSFQFQIEEEVGRSGMLDSLMPAGNTAHRRKVSGDGASFGVRHETPGTQQAAKLGHLQKAQRVTEGWAKHAEQQE